MKAMVIGLGSMGQRRIRLIKKAYPHIPVCGVDSQQTRREAAAEKWDIPVFKSIDDAVSCENPDMAFVCTSPLSHSELIHSCLKYKLHVFTEINLVSDGYEESIELARQNGKTLFLSSTFLYRDETRYICGQAQAQSKPLSYHYHVGQYLPDWHPWESYTDYFIGDARTNGCRELLAIELPWLIRAFGKIDSVKVSRRKLTELKTTYDDCVFLIVEHSGGTIGSICIDVVSRKAVRKFELVGEDVYLTWEGTPDSLRVYDAAAKQESSVLLTDKIDREAGYAAFIVENAYANEISAFIDAVNGASKPVYGFANDKETLDLIDYIEAQK